MRHSTFSSAEFVDLLKKYRVAAVFGDSGGKWPVIDEPTTDFRYARLHADTAIYTEGFYEPSDLDRWAQRVSAWLDSGQDAYIYFDNDSKVRAPIDAMSLIERLSTH